MRSPGEVSEKLYHLVWYKRTLVANFYVLDMTVQQHTELTAFCRTLDNEMQLLRWVLGQAEQTWTDDLSGAIDILDYYRQLPPTEFAHLPARKTLSYWQERGVIPPCSPGAYVETEYSPR